MNESTTNRRSNSVFNLCDEQSDQQMKKLLTDCAGDNNKPKPKVVRERRIPPNEKVWKL